jgi:hypothetical protein
MAGLEIKPLFDCLAAEGCPGRITILSAVGTCRRMMVSEALQQTAG